MISSPSLAEAMSAGSVFLLLYCGLGLAAFFTLAARVFAPGGARVAVEGFGAREAGVVVGLVFYYGLLGAGEFATAGALPPNPEKQVSILSGLMIGTAMQVMVVVIVLASLRGRLPMTEIFGLRAVSWWRAALLGLGFLILLYPVIFLASQLTVDEEVRPENLQRLVQFFQNGSWRERAAVTFTGMLVAPLVEEFVFRGLIYGVSKRFGGAAGAAIFSSAFFAFIHGHIPSLGPLFALGLCLALAYEFTGSLLVPIALHAWFNGYQLLAMALASAK